MVFDDGDHERCAQVANTREGSTRKARKQAEQLLGLTPCQLVEPDFSRKDGTDDELCATMRVEQLACLGHVAIDGARGQRQRAGNLLVREAAPGKDDARSEERLVGKECVSKCRSRW